MRKKERYDSILEYFGRENPSPETELHYADPFQLLVAVILSAQCTDKRVNVISPSLFKKFPNAKSLAKADVIEIYELIKSCTYPNNKAKHLSGMSKMLISDFEGKVPSSLIDLQKLPGVGRKTANVIASIVFREPAMPVDTHVFRVSRRIGLAVNAKTPLQVEKQLTKNIPNEQIAIAHHWLLLHGRYVCKARRPLCDDCGIKQWCKHYEVKG